MARRPAAHNPMIWVRRSKTEIEQAQIRAARNVHEHNYYQHPTLHTHMQCADCGYWVRRDFAPADLIFSGPVKVKGK